MALGEISFKDIYLKLSSIRNGIANGTLREDDKIYLEELEYIEIKNKYWYLIQYGAKKTLHYYQLSEYEQATSWIQFIHNLPKYFSKKEKWNESWFYEGELLSFIETANYEEIKECISILGRED